MFHRGRNDRPLAIFVSGMGIDISIWSDPQKTKVMGGLYPLKSLVKGVGPNARTAFMDLQDREFSVLLWNQKRPAGPIEIAVDELRGLIAEYKEYAGEGILLICHSRGGLIARKYLEKGDNLVRCVITLASPHHGTTMAKWAAYLSPIGSSLEYILKGIRKEDINSAVHKILRFLDGKGLREMLPDSDFFKNLRDSKQKGTRYISIGGTNPDFVRIGGGLPLFELLSKVIPSGLIPEELREGCGDGMVSAASAVLPYADDHYNFHVNHASVLFDEEVRGHVLKAAELL